MFSPLTTISENPSREKTPCRMSATAVANRLKQMLAKPSASGEDTAAVTAADATPASQYDEDYDDSDEDDDVAPSLAPTRTAEEPRSSDDDADEDESATAEMSQAHLAMYGITPPTPNAGRTTSFGGTKLTASLEGGGAAAGGVGSGTVAGETSASPPPTPVTNVDSPENVAVHSESVRGRKKVKDDRMCLICGARVYLRLQKAALRAFDVSADPTH